MQPIDLENVFSYHAPSGPEQVAIYQSVRDGGKTLAQLIDASVPDGPEKTLAIRKVQEAVMWANAGIACEPKFDKGGHLPPGQAPNVLPC